MRLAAVVAAVIFAIAIVGLVAWSFICWLPENIGNESPWAQFWVSVHTELVGMAIEVIAVVMLIGLIAKRIEEQRIAARADATRTLFSNQFQSLTRQLYELTVILKGVVVDQSTFVDQKLTLSKHQLEAAAEVFHRKNQQLWRLNRFLLDVMVEPELRVTPNHQGVPLGLIDALSEASEISDNIETTLVSLVHDSAHPQIFAARLIQLLNRMLKCLASLGSLEDQFAQLVPDAQPRLNAASENVRNSLARLMGVQRTFEDERNRLVELKAMATVQVI